MLSSSQACTASTHQKPAKQFMPTSVHCCGEQRRVDGCCTADAAVAACADEPAEAGTETLEDKLTRQLREAQAKLEAAQKELGPLVNELNIFSKKTTKAQRVLAVIWCAHALSGRWSLQSMHS